MIRKKVLILNQDFSPMQVIGWQRAFVLSYIGKEIPGEGCNVVEFYNDEVVYSAGGKAFQIPAVMVTNRYVKRKRVPMNKRTVFARDNHSCQYCGRKFPSEYLTYDHVISKFEWRRKGLPGNYTNWTNIVTACTGCNRRKGSKSLEKCGLKLLSQPREPDYATYIRGLIGDKVPPEWRVYLGLPQLDN
jgi:hypothetical protein